MSKKITIIKIKSANAALSGLLVLMLPLFVQAGVLDSLMNAADQALVTYGRDSTVVGHEVLPSEVVSKGLREVLTQGSNNVGKRLTAENAYGGDSAIRIVLPEAWDEARDIAERIGLKADFDDLEQQLNRAAEAAVPATRDYLTEAIDGLQLDNAQEILRAGDTAATAHLRRSVMGEIERVLRPHVKESLLNTGATGQKIKISRRIARLPMIRDLSVDLADHVVELSLDGFFHYLRKEEQIIRKDPSRHSTEILKKVFG